MRISSKGIYEYNVRGPGILNVGYEFYWWYIICHPIRTFRYVIEVEQIKYQRGRGWRRALEFYYEEREFNKDLMRKASGRHEAKQKSA